MGLWHALGAIGAAILGFRLLGSRRAEASRSSPPPPPGRDEDRDGDAREAGRRGDEDAPPAGGRDLGGGGGPATPPAMLEWSRILAPMCASGPAPRPQLPYVLRWIDLESGGNPCEVGYPPARGPDGQPLELGIAQLYNPDDLGLADPPLTGAELRAYCVPGDQHEISYRGRIVRGFSGRMSRPMTPDEMGRQAESAIGLVRRCAASAARDLASIDAGPQWAPDRRGFWAIAKLQHGLPDLSHQGLPAVTQKLGRPPASWREFRDTLGAVTMRPNVEKYRADFPRILDNAEACAASFSEEDRGVA
jgi:hypothetical protein